MLHPLPVWESDPEVIFLNNLPFLFVRQGFFLGNYLHQTIITWEKSPCDRNTESALIKSPGSKQKSHLGWAAARCGRHTHFDRALLFILKSSLPIIWLCLSIFCSQNFFSLCLSWIRAKLIACNEEAKCFTVMDGRAKGALKPPFNCNGTRVHRALAMSQTGFRPYI